jgi:hypothetical protein
MPFAMTAKPFPEPDPDAWRRFERAVDAALHTLPMHRESKGKPSRKSPDKGRPEK